ncbi:MAG TPA: IS21 family transposase [Firmicutes bacterium]|nr:IS21 family transposase [Bacillota bacterium]
MKIEVDTYERIRYLYVHEKKSQREIARLLGISRTTVRKYCDGTVLPSIRKEGSGRKSHIVTDEVITFIEECLLDDKREKLKKQRHTAKRIHSRLVEELDFTGGESTVRRVVASMKDKLPKAFIPLSYEPAEAAQIDWGEATIYLSGERIKVNLFCMRLCYSAGIFVKAYFRQNEESFLDGNLSGFEFFNGVPQKLIFDNAKVAVKEGFGVHAKPQARYKSFAAHYAFTPEFCNIASGHEKGLVEGLVGWVRRNHLVPLPRVKTLDELNAFLIKKCTLYYDHQIKERKQTVGEMFEVEANFLTTLPAYRFDVSRSITVKADQFSTVKFDYNYYSVPIEYAGKSVSIKGFGNDVYIYYQHQKIAHYQRQYVRGETFYTLDHYMKLIEQRPRSVYNAKPVKQSVSQELLEIGKRLNGPREMVKLLRMCIDCGEERVIQSARTLVGNELTLGQIQGMLIEPPTEIVQTTIKDEISVTKPNLGVYDELLKGESKWVQ